MPKITRICNDREILTKGIWCQDCNGFHAESQNGVLSEKERMRQVLQSIRQVARMLHDDDISSRDAAKTLFLLLDKPGVVTHRKHD